MTALPAAARYDGAAQARKEAPGRRRGPKRRVTISPGRYGDTRLVVIGEVAPVIDGSGQARRAVLCKCDCDTEVTIKLSNLPRTQSCGCLRRDANSTAPSQIREEAPAGRPSPPRRVTISPGRYGDTRLVVIGEVAPVIDGSGQARRAVLCKCDCDTEVTIKLSNLPRTQSCGCLRRDANATRNRRRREGAAGT